MAKGKRSSLYEMDMTWQKWKRCDICSLRICVNNNDQRKARTPKFKGFVVCTDCDPRSIWDRIANKQEGAVIMHPRRLRIIRLAQVTRGLAKFGCLRALEDGPCKCAGCAAKKLMEVHG